MRNLLAESSVRLLAAINADRETPYLRAIVAGFSPRLTVCVPLWEAVAPEDEPREEDDDESIPPLETAPVIGVYCGRAAGGGGVCGAGAGGTIGVGATTGVCGAGRLGAGAGAGVWTAGSGLSTGIV